MLTSRERVQRTLNHQEPDLVPLDLGGSVLTGMHVDAVYRLRQALGLDEPGTPVKVIDPYQMLGEIKLDLADRLGADIVRLGNPRTMFGFRNENWKPWTTFAGTPVLVPGGFNTELEPNGDLLLYPEGDKSAPPSGIMPADGFYFDAIVRQPPIDDANLNVEDNVEEFRPISAADLEYYAAQAERLYTQTDKAILGDFGGTAFGDIAMVPAAWLKHPRGIRDVAEWYMSAITRRDYVYAIFERQCEIGLENLAKIYEVVGEKVMVLQVTGTDFGTQNAPFISPQTYCDLYQPFHKQVNDWVHAHTGWKTFIHTDGALMPLMPHFVAAGFDILNPVQFTAKGMEPETVKAKFGENLTLWGAGVDTQKVLPFGTPDEVRAQVRENIRVFAPGGGFVFGTVHNVQPPTPVENLLAMYETVAEMRAYPIR
ncbi:MAG: uroporphyrinogen decarboxylase family protein [Chloroflexota bacterium]|nr:uroporphyrinogen decarboxylase family protein [Chloroflexota bacterium]